MTRLLLISGSLRNGSTNTATMRTVQAVAPAEITTCIYGGMRELPHFNPVAWINVSGPAAPTGGSDAHDSLRKVLGYVHADLIEPACLRLPLTRDAIGSDGTITDPSSRAQIAVTLKILTGALSSREVAG
jgi:chromate reductase